ncbi:MAG: hypothetical protein CSB21_01640 [Deltaproteobacteria bacterium]|nr:MAG: hypothetical protein CSB21_01640 [Deltaproteobacteria bacterium]
MQETIAIVSPLPPPYGGMAIQAEKLYENLKNEGLAVRKIPTNLRFNKLEFIEKIPFLRTLARMFVFLLHLNRELKDIDCIYFLTGFYNFFFWVTLPAIILIKLKRKRIILSARGGDAKKFFRENKTVTKFFLKQVDIVTTPSFFLKKIFMEELNIKAKVIPNIADLSQFEFIKKEKFKPKIIVTRALEEIYDVEGIIRAFDIISGKISDAELGIVGGGSLEASLKELVFELGLSEKVYFYGEVEHKKLPFIYKKYDIFMNASKVDNLPGSILEAFASGLPVVSTDSGGISYMVENNFSGLLCKAGGYKSLAENALKIINNPEKGIYLSKNGYMEIEKYKWTNIKKILVPLLQNEN